MDLNPTVKKLIQVSEEAAPVVQRNELFVLTQQDIRRVEDIRTLSYRRLSAQDHVLASAFTNLAGGTPAPEAQGKQDQPVDLRVEAPEPEVTQNVGNVANQMKWSNQLQTSSPFPLHYTVGTSTSGLQTGESGTNAKSPSKQHQHTSCQTDAITSTAACNTDPATQNSISASDEMSLSPDCHCSSSLSEMSKQSASRTPPLCVPNSNYLGQHRRQHYKNRPESNL